jgi:hypothetical protein
MKFKELLERMDQISTIYALMSGHIQLSNATMKDVFPLHGKTDTFKHITDNEGLEWLLKNEGQKVSGIAVEKFGRLYSGLATEGSLITILEGDYIFWSITDFHSLVDKQGRRYLPVYRTPEEMDITVGFHSSGVFRKFIKDYHMQFEYLVYKYFGDIEELENYIDTARLYMNVEELNKILYGDNKEYTKRANNFIKDVLKLQHTVLKKHKDDISKRTLANMGILQHGAKNPSTYVKAYEWDEAIINNHKVKQVIIRVYEEYKSERSLKQIFNRWALDIGNYNVDKKVAERRANSFLRGTDMYRTIQILKKNNYKGLVSFVDGKKNSADFSDIKEIMKDEEFNRFIEALGLKHYKGVFFKVK